MSSFIYFNGSFFPSGTALLTADNRGFRYGDGLFETIRVRDGHILLSHYHFDRLMSGVRLLQMGSPFPDLSSLTDTILELCRKNGHLASARVRLTVFRGEVGQDDARPDHILQSWPLEQPGPGLAPQGLVLGVFPDGRKSCDPFANLKSNNYLIYSMAALYARQGEWDDCLVLNSWGRVADTSIANLFYVRKGIIYTPPLSEGCVGGVMRRRLLEVLPPSDFPIEEKPVTLEDLATAEEVFLTNAIRGIRWVRGWGGRIYGNKVVEALGKIIHEDIG